MKLIYSGDCSKTIRIPSHGKRPSPDNDIIFYFSFLFRVKYNYDVSQPIMLVIYKHVSRDVQSSQYRSSGGLDEAGMFRKALAVVRDGRTGGHYVLMVSCLH